VDYPEVFGLPVMSADDALASLLGIPVAAKG
jgi:hypothetical protein